jgi:hypothetical protein
MQKKLKLSIAVSNHDGCFSMPETNADEKRKRIKKEPLARLKEFSN